MCALAEKLTRDAHATGEQDIAASRSAGLSDREILDLVQIIAYFNYVNRLASALGVELEPR